MEQSHEKRINEREIICVICPNSCRLTVWQDTEGEVHVTGNKCNRGMEYGKSEYTNPVRMLITTMRVEGGVLPVIPVRSEKPIPKELLLKAVKRVNESFCTAPIKMGQVLMENILETGVSVIASRDLEQDLEKLQACSIYDEMTADEVIEQTIIEDIFQGKRILKPEEEKLKEQFKNHLLERLTPHLR